MVFLKRLILEGFKSYGSRRVELPLSRGFNAVIGPNGSGKSNIVDALVFVLGGLSTKTMRAASLSDLIFAGTSEENPSRRTRVELVLDNTDQQIPLNTEELRVSREVRSSGSSVYRLNGVVSTRKELIDLLALGNLGSHNNNRNIVLQGEIAQLASMTPLERRALVESVAGIAVFDEKKVESQRELEQTRTRFREIDLLLGNIRETRDRLALEKEEAEKYVNLQLEIEKKTAFMLTAREMQLEAKIAQLNQSSELHRKQRASLQKKRTKLNLEISNLDEQLISLDQEYSNLQEQKLSQLFSLSDKKRAEKIEFEAKATFDQEKITQYQREHKKLDRKVNEFKETRKQLNQREIALTNGISEVSLQLEAKNTSFLKLRSELETLDKTLEHDREQARQLTKKVADTKQQKIECESRRTFLHSICQSNANLLNEIQIKSENQQKLLNQLEEKLEALSQQRIEIEQYLSKIKGRVEKLQERKTPLETQLKNMREELSKTETEKIQLETELRVLKEEKTGEAITEAADAILLATQRGELDIQGIRGPVSTLFSFPLALRTLLNTTFPTVMGALLVEDVKTAARIVEFAKRNRLGQTVIYIQELIKKAAPQQALPNSIAAFAECTEEDWPLGVYLFGNLCLLDHLGDISVDSNAYVYLTQQGDLFDPRQARLIAADPGQARIRLLQDELLPRVQETFEEQTHNKNLLDQESITLSQELNMLDDQIKTKSARTTELVKREMALRDEIERTRTNFRDLILQTEDLERQNKESQRELNSLDATITELTKTLPLQEDELTKLTEQLEGSIRRDLEQQLDILRNDLDELRTTQNDLQLEYEKIKTRINDIIEPEIQNNLQRQEELLQQIDETKQHIKTLEESRHQTEQELTDLTIKIKAVREKMTNLSEQRDLLRKARDEIAKQLATTQQKFDQILQVHRELELEMKQYEVELENVQQNAARLGTPQRFDGVDISNLDPVHLREEVLQLQHKKTDLGSVNLKAPEQFEEIDHRYKALLSKRETLKQERKVLLEIIDELEQKKRKTFFLTFESLNSHFNEIFRRLSPGPESYARLILENPQNPFEGGTLIEARPQGKRIKSIASMSGGEKSLVALALLIAIQKVESCPFWILDEIDAFLDSANVNRVAKLLSEISQETQILLVTLREPMMALADRLYAVSNINGISIVFGIVLQDILDGRIQLEGGEGETNAELEEVLIDR